MIVMWRKATGEYVLACFLSATMTEKGANFLLNTEMSRNNQAKVPNRTPFFTCIFEPPIKKSSQKLTMNKYSHKNNNIYVGFVERAHVKDEC